VTHLRKMMLEELQRLDYSEATTRYHLRKVEAFARHFRRPPAGIFEVRLSRAIFTGLKGCTCSRRGSVHQKCKWNSHPRKHNAERLGD